MYGLSSLPECLGLCPPMIYIVLDTIMKIKFQGEGLGKVNDTTHRSSQGWHMPRGKRLSSFSF